MLQKDVTFIMFTFKIQKTLNFKHKSIFMCDIVVVAGIFLF